MHEFFSFIQSGGIVCSSSTSALQQREWMLFVGRATNDPSTIQQSFDFVSLRYAYTRKPLTLLQASNILTAILLLDHTDSYLFTPIKSITEKAQSPLTQCSKQRSPTTRTGCCLIDTVVACPTPVIGRDLVNVLNSSGNDLGSVVGNAVGTPVTGLILNDFCCHWVIVFL